MAFQVASLTSVTISSCFDVLTVAYYQGQGPPREPCTRKLPLSIVAIKPHRPPTRAGHI